MIINNNRLIFSVIIDSKNEFVFCDLLLCVDFYGIYVSYGVE